MRLGLNIIVVLALSVGVVALERPISTPAKQGAAGGTATQQSDTALLVQIEKDLFNAKFTSNPEVIGKFLAEDWVNISPTGRGWGKPELMEHLRRHPGVVQPYSAQQQDLQVYVFGNTAVATYVEDVTAKPEQNMPWGTRLQTDGTDVFVKGGGTWKLRLSRGSPHPPQ